jgi:hypothetical protein
MIKKKRPMKKKQQEEKSKIPRKKIKRNKGAKISKPLIDLFKKIEKDRKFAL